MNCCTDTLCNHPGTASRTIAPSKLVLRLQSVWLPPTLSFCVCYSMNIQLTACHAECHTSYRMLVHFLLAHGVSSAGHAIPKPPQYVDEVTSTNDTSNLSCLCIPETSCCHALLMQSMKGLSDRQLHIKQHHFAAFWYELVHIMRRQEILEALSGISWLICLRRGGRHACV